MRRLTILFLSLVILALAEEGAKYLIISDDSYLSIVSSLAEWKTKKGVLAKVVPVSQVGTTPQQIQSYIRDAYNNWPVRPEFVLLVGSPNQIPSYNGTTDCYYGDMTGDYKMEISVGRFFVFTARECSTMVAKVMNYERPDMGAIDTLYFLKGTTIVREDEPPDAYYQADARLVRSLWRSAGYTVCESLLSTQGHNSNNVNAAAQDGRMFLTYRGQGVYNWWAPFNNVEPSSWNNGRKLPIVISGSCAMIDLSSGNVQGDRFVRTGTPQSLGGALAYFGTTYTGSHISDRRSACFRGFFTALFQEGEFRLGPATLRGRFWVDSLFHSQQFYQEWNLLGDPELNVWTGVPKEVTVSYDSVINRVPQTFRVTVSRGGAPEPGALVCVSMDSTVYVTAFTDTQGEANLVINPMHIGTMDVVVTGRNILPFIGTARVIATGMPYIVVEGTAVDDYIGNQDHQINPGERVRLLVTLRNVGGAPAEGVNGLLRINANWVRIFDSVAVYGMLLPESSATGDQFEMWVDTLVGDGTLIPARIFVRDVAGDSWWCSLDLFVRAGKIVFNTATFFDSPPGGNGNGRVGRSENGRVQIAVRNQGGGGLAAVSCVLTCGDPNVVVVDSTGFYGLIAAGGIHSGVGDRFAISAGPALVKNRPVRFQMRVSGAGGTYRYSDTFSFEIAGEEGLTNDPTGPDQYGYFCYDDTDTASGQAPVYEWRELAPPGPGEVIPAVSDSDAVTVTLRMPFPFRYYGKNDSFMSVCSNGFLALGVTAYRRGTNYPVPDSGGAPLMIAPFWDDLNPDERRNGYGTAYQYYDTANHRWIVEFQDFAHYNQPNIRETFQVVFYDPVYYPTVTGDGEIEFYYQRVSLSSGCTVGIEDSTERIGVQYLYNNVYAPTAAYLQAGRAIKWTTNPPRMQIVPWLVLVRVLVSDTLAGNGNSIWEPGETVQIGVVVRNQGGAEAVNATAVLRSDDGDALVTDSLTVLGVIPIGDTVSNIATPFWVQISNTPRDSILDFRLKLQADGYAATGYLSVGISGVTGSAEERGIFPLISGLAGVRPNPVNRTVLISYTVSQPGQVDLALFDVTGRRFRQLVRGFQPAGGHQVQLSPEGLPAGIYFCRLQLKERSTVKSFVQRFEVVR